MTVKIGTNGFGRTDRLAFRCTMDLGEKSSDVGVVAINDLTTPALLAHLLKYDSIRGILNHEVSATGDSIVVDGKKYRIYAEPQVQNLPWVKNDGVDFVLECTGFHTNKAKSQAYPDTGAKGVLIFAPAGNDLRTTIYSVNDDTLTADDKIVSAGSCTTNSLAPMVSVLNKEPGTEVDTMITVHTLTPTQMVLDGPVRGGNFRVARTSSANIIPHLTGAAKAIGLVIPELNGKLQGHAQRVPVADSSGTELASVLSKGVTADEINAVMRRYESASSAYNDDQTASNGILGTTAGSIFDPTQTEVTTAGDKQLVKTVAWYDNEYSSTYQMVRTLLKFATL